jgi:protein arginine kinase
MSSRVRLARNLAGYPFMPKATRSERQEVLAASKARILTAGVAERVIWIDLHTSNAMERSLLFERHLISRNHLRGKLSSGTGGTDEPRGVAISIPDERLSIMVNEEDHLRIQVMRSGLALDAAIDDAMRIDDAIEQKVEYAFDPRFGYLTACPTNVGSGARFSVMVHLPALAMTGEVEKVRKACADMNLAVRGFYGEGSEAIGDFYQISNQTTLGRSERELMSLLQMDIVPRVVAYERASREQLVSKRRETLEDQAHRALGVLSHARLLGTDEAMTLLSHLRLGVVAGVVDAVDARAISNLVLLVQPAHLQRVLAKDLDQQARRGARAELVRGKIEQAIKRVAGQDGAGPTRRM